MLETPASDPTPLGESTPHKASPLAAYRLQLDLERVELENARLREELRSREHTFILLRRALDGGRTTIWIVASWVPLTAVQPIASSFAGQNTNFRASLTVTLAFSIVVSSALIAALVQSRLRKRKVQTQRARLDQLEAQVLQQQRQLAAMETRQPGGKE